MHFKVATQHSIFGKKVFVSGGAGFIGSNCIDRLLFEGVKSVTIYDNFSTGQNAFLAHILKDPRVTIIKNDILNTSSLHEAMKGHDIVFQLQANADVRGGMTNTRIDLDQNVIGTWNLLEGMRIHKISTLLFASSAAVYGEPSVFPTPEHNVLKQTSVYGASKLAGEAYIEAYSNYFGIKAIIFRFVSWIGERYSHGVIFDFMKKLKQDPTKLEILGNGKQKKSYLYVQDGITGILTALENSQSPAEVFNVGHDETLDVKRLAEIVIDELKMTNVKLVFGTGDRGWAGDAPFVHLDTTKLKNFGWTPQTHIEEGIRKTVRYLNANEWIFGLRK